jgi:hypothetical protein
MLQDPVFSRELHYRGSPSFAQLFATTEIRWLLQQSGILAALASILLMPFKKWQITTTTELKSPFWILLTPCCPDPR